MGLSPAPSGAQFELRHGDQVAIVTEVGATIRHYSAGGRPVLDGFAAEEICSGARGQQLVPWPNRIRDGRYRYAGKDQQLALTEPANRNAIHGLARWVTWQCIEAQPDRVQMALVVRPQPGWPGSLAVEVEIVLGSAGLEVTTTARNVGATSVPYGAGAHPYLTLGAERVDTHDLLVPADRYAAPDDRGIAVGAAPVEGTAYDFRTARPIGDLVLDTAYTDLSRHEDGRWRVRLSEGDRAPTLWGDAAYTWLQLFTGDTLPESKARRGLAVEPMTCGPDAFNTGEGLIVLQPGDSHRGQWGISPG